MSKNPYEILGVDHNSTLDQVKTAYRKLAKQYHPDVNPDNKESEEKFKDIAEAYSILSDKEKKTNYDRFGTADGRTNPFGGMDMNDFEEYADREVVSVEPDGEGGYDEELGDWEMDENTVSLEL
jgi:DnaJ-class molecular chaperone